MDLNSVHGAVALILQQFGSSCTLQNPSGDEGKTRGVIMSKQSKPGDADDFISENERICYLTGKSKIVPENGSSITFGTELYIVKDVRVLAVGEGRTSVFAYRCVVGV